jgi:hypothetical protein
LDRFDGKIRAFAHDIGQTPKALQTFPAGRTILQMGFQFFLPGIGKLPVMVKGKHLRIRAHRDHPFLRDRPNAPGL